MSQQKYHKPDQLYQHDWIPMSLLIVLASSPIWLSFLNL